MYKTSLSHISLGEMEPAIDDHVFAIANLMAATNDVTFVTADLMCANANLVSLMWQLSALA